MTQNEPNFLPYAAKIAAQDKAIAELRLRALRGRVHKLEYQVDWYERAPLSWLLKKTLRAFDNAVTSRMTREPQRVTVYDAQATAATEGTPADVLRQLAESYQHSVSTKEVDGKLGAYYLLLPIWFVYRIVRKAAKVGRHAVKRGA